VALTEAACRGEGRVTETGSNLRCLAVRVRCRIVERESCRSRVLDNMFEGLVLESGEEHCSSMTLSSLHQSVIKLPPAPTSQQWPRPFR